MASESRRRSSAVSVGNWMWTLFLNGNVVINLIHLLACVIAYQLCFSETWSVMLPGIWRFVIPGCLVLTPLVSLILWIVTAIVSRKASKRKWAIASILWFVITFVLVLLAVVFFGDKIMNLPITDLLGGAAAAAK